MDQDVAKKLVQDTLENSFDQEKFSYFINNMLNSFEEDSFTYKGKYIFDSFKDSIRILQRIGKYKGPDDKLVDILVVHLKQDTSLEHARSMQRNFIAKYLKGSRGGVLKDAALVAFVAPDGKDWRFSIVKMEYKFNEIGKIKEDFTPAKRYSFLVGENESSHTAQSRILPALLNDEDNPTLTDLEDIFSVEPVTKEFFENYRNLFLQLNESLESIVRKDNEVRKDFKEKNVDSVDFAKKLLGQIIFLYFLQKKGWFGVKRGGDWGTGPKQFLRELFDKKHAKYKNFFDDILEPLFYEALSLEHADDYYSHFACRIPFLNGGLFDPINNYDWVNADVLLPNEMFSNKNITKEGDVGNGILDVFDRYNFTVKEDEPLEKEVAVDPEMLGKVFENLLEVKDRKSKGTYYTPREIVHYMCQESLSNYLASQLDGKVCKEDIERLIKLGEEIVENDRLVASGGQGKKSRYYFGLGEKVRVHAKEIDNKLKSIRICDPAVGSGAFPVGMMNEIVRARNVLSVYINDKETRTAYNFKRHAIQNCLYGVDIDPGAVEIAKLRLWLSLVIDEEERKTVQPLPNLDYKIVQGDSLSNMNIDIFNNDQFNELNKLKLDYFNETSSRKKQNLRQKIDGFIDVFTDRGKHFDFAAYFSEIFSKNEGFDVVIANPPYISHDKIKGKNRIAKLYKTYEPFADIYCYFMEVALKIQNSRGIICYITSNSYIKSEYGKPLRGLIKEKCFIRSIINIQNYQAFESAIVNIAILIAQNNKSKNINDSIIVNNAYDSNRDSFDNFVTHNKIIRAQDYFGTEPWYLIDKNTHNLKIKIEKAGRTLAERGTKIRLGIATGANSVFVIDETKKNELIKKDHKNKNIIKQILRGRDIYRYGLKFNNRYIVLAANGINIKDKYPIIYEYLNLQGDKFKKRSTKGDNWYNLRSTAFLNDFQEEKIIWMELTDCGRFALCKDNIYLLNSAYFLIPPNKISSKYLLAILNSKVIGFYLKLIAETSGMGVARWIKTHVKEFPIPDIPEDEKVKIHGIVDKIITVKKESNMANEMVREYEDLINSYVYKLYNLDDDEIKIIESYTACYLQT